MLSVREQPVEHSIGNSLFVKTQWDEEVGTSYEDRKFMTIMEISNIILPSGTNGGILSAMELRCKCNFATSGVGISEASFGILLFTGRSCSKTVLVRVFPYDKPEKAVTTYAILDEHSNKTLACSELVDLLGVVSGRMVPLVVL
jgi:hypothetical protein